MPIDVTVEAYYDTAWSDITDDVRQESAADGGIDIARGRSPESTQAHPGSAELALNNGTSKVAPSVSGRYSPRNPRSDLYGKLTRNTPLRISIGDTPVSDFGARTASNGWGNAVTGQAWTTVNGDAADYAVSGGEGTIDIDTLNSNRQTWINVSYADVTLEATIAVGVVATGREIVTALTARRQDDTVMFRFELVWATNSFVTSRIVHPTAGTLAQDINGFAYTASTSVRVQIQLAGRVLRMRAWDAAGDPPAPWTVQYYDADDLITDAGALGFRCILHPDNTNTLPVTVTVSDVQVPPVRRFVGEVSQWPPRWDVSDADRWVPIEAAGVLRRLGATTAQPLRSAMRRAILASSFPELSPPIELRAYWPHEDLANSFHAASGLANLPRMRQSGGTIVNASSGVVVGSLPLPDWLESTGRATGQVTGVDGNWTTGFVIAFAGTNTWNAIEVDLTTGPWLKLRLTFTSILTLTGFDETGSSSIGTVATDLSDGQPHWIALLASVSGGNIDYQVRVDGDSASTFGSTAGSTAGRIQSVTVKSRSAGTSATLGHIAVWEGIDSSIDDVIVPAVTGHAGEHAGRRIERLCDQEGLAFVQVGDLDDTAPCGPQLVDTLLANLQHAADTDLGILHETRDEIGLTYRTGRDLYNQAATLTLDYAADEVAPPLEPVDDDQALANDVTATRPDGSSARAALESGPLSIQPPPDGVGAYDAQVEVHTDSDGRLEDHAGWRLHLGTVDEARYPTIAVNLSAPAVSGDAALTAAVLAVESGDRVDVDNPPGCLPPETIATLAQGYTELIYGFTHEIAFNAVPESPYHVAEVEHDDYSIIGNDTTSRSGSAINATQTSISLNVGGGHDWVHEVDFDILMGGERMTVTAIGAASGTYPSRSQTFTVVRSVNGVVKSHPDGTTMRLLHPSYIGL